MRSTKNREQFAQIINDLVSGEIRTGLSSTKRRWIPKYVYHFTDITNANNILSSGYIYSRKKASELGIMEVDNASENVINYTNEKWKSFARFYFRPKTPTQFRNEGIRALSQITDLNAHCPVPVFFLFDSLSMLTLEESLFSYGNLAVNDTVYNDADSFREMPFSSVFHEGSYDTILEAHIKFNRHAELIVPEKCSLENLKKIVCRSAAEKETFMNILDSKVRERFKDIIVVDTRNNFFNGQWTYIEEVSLMKEEMVFTYNRPRNHANFNAYLEIVENETNIKYTWKKEGYELKHPQSFNLLNLKKPDHYDVSFYLDGHLAYKGVYMSDDYLPF